ncbi:MAG: hypothetical protein OXF27_04390, partial [Acidobacteria bacterium]|nr:hypothetical protein [Acidobacteriota bacterium]
MGIPEDFSAAADRRHLHPGELSTIPDHAPGWLRYDYGTDTVAARPRGDRVVAARPQVKLTKRA